MLNARGVENDKNSKSSSEINGNENNANSKENTVNKEGNGITYFGFVNKNTFITPIENIGECDIIFLVYYRRDKETYYFKLVDKTEDFSGFTNINYKMVS